jgi:hypothetical protein
MRMRNCFEISNVDSCSRFLLKARFLGAGVDGRASSPEGAAAHMSGRMHEERKSALECAIASCYQQLVHDQTHCSNKRATAEWRSEKERERGRAGEE